MQVHFLEETVSTNLVLKQMALEGSEEGTVVWSLKQSSGRGRLGRKFSSPQGGIYMSVLLKQDNTMTITARAAVAVRRALLELCSIPTQIKWVNDILLNGKKVAGILAEAVADKVVVGIGLNYCTPLTAFSEDLRPIVGSLFEKPFDEMPPKEEVVKTIAKALLSKQENWLEEYRENNIVPGKKVQIFQAGVETGRGTAVSIDDNCFLHVQTIEGKEIVLSSGEVSVREWED